MDTTVADIAQALGPKLLDSDDLASALNVSRRTVEDWRLRGRGPRYIRMSSRAVRYRPTAVAEWLAEREVASTSDPGGAM